MSDHFLPGVLESAIERAKGKILPVVVYQDGVRHIVGEALVEEDGSLTTELSTEGFKILNLHTDLQYYYSIGEPDAEHYPSLEEFVGLGQTSTDPLPQDSERLRLIRQASSQQSNPIQPK